MWVRKRIDIGWSDLLVAATNCFRSYSESSAARLAEATWSADSTAVSCLSVRSGFDLLLTALQLPVGSEILVSAITIPDMVRILTHHGLVPIPVDLHADDISPSIELLEKLLTPSTKAILVAHLFGGRADLRPNVQFARQYGLLLFEDCAQAFEGNRYRGNEAADVSMFSFGPIKTATALGGAILRIQNEPLRRAVRELQSKYPMQSRWNFFRRVLTYCGFKWLGGRIAFAIFARICDLLEKDLDKVLNGAARNFDRSDLFKALRLQPSMPLLLLMARRIAKFRYRDLDRRIALGRLLIRLLPEIALPVNKAIHHSFWVFPLCVGDKASAVASLRNAGFDATAASSLRIVEAPVNRPDSDPKTAKVLLASIIYLPLYLEMPEAEIHRMASVVISMGMGKESHKATMTRAFDGKSLAIAAREKGHSRLG